VRPAYPLSAYLLSSQIVRLEHEKALPNRRAFIGLWLTGLPLSFLPVFRLYEIPVGDNIPHFFIYFWRFTYRSNDAKRAKNLGE